MHQLGLAYQRSRPLQVRRHLMAYIRSSDEMRALWSKLPTRFDPRRSPERCGSASHDHEEGANYMPDFPVPEGEDKTSWFIKEVERGSSDRFRTALLTPCASRPSTRKTSSFRWASRLLPDRRRLHQSRSRRAWGLVASGCRIDGRLRILELNPLIVRFEDQPERISMPDSPTS